MKSARCENISAVLEITYSNLRRIEMAANFEGYCVVLTNLIQSTIISQGGTNVVFSPISNTVKKGASDGLIFKFEIDSIESLNTLEKNIKKINSGEIERTYVFVDQSTEKI